MPRLNTLAPTLQGSTQVCTPPHTHTPHIRPLTDQDMGYGPSMLGAKMKAGDDHVFHPPAPPITQTDGSMEAHHEVVPHDSNFIMAKRTDDGSTIRKVRVCVLVYTPPHPTHPHTHAPSDWRDHTEP